MPTPTFTAAIYSRMATDSTLAGMISTYNGNPAIFTENPIPHDAARPYIVAAGAVHDGPFDGKVEQGREVTRDIKIYTDGSGSEALIEQIAERIRALFHHAPLPTVTMGVMILINTIAEVIAGPFVVPTDAVIQGLALTVRWHLYPN